MEQVADKAGFSISIHALLAESDASACSASAFVP